jgi:transcriptional regulator with XRE-family HTH domain
MFNLDRFSARLTELREARGLSLSQVGDVVGISKVSIFRLEKGRNYPQANTLVALADYFDVSLDYLVGRSGDPTRLP